MPKLELNSKFSFGNWKDKTVQEIADTNWFGFKILYDKNPFIFGDTVRSYVKDVNASIRRLTMR